MIPTLPAGHPGNRPSIKRLHTAIYEKYPWLNFHFPERDKENFDEVVLDISHLDDEPYSSDYNSENIFILDASGKTIHTVGYLPNFAWWKIWLWLRQVNHRETIGEALLHKKCVNAAYVLSDDGLRTITIFSPRARESLHELATRHSLDVL